MISKESLLQEQQKHFYMLLSAEVAMAMAVAKFDVSSSAKCHNLLKYY